MKNFSRFLLLALFSLMAVSTQAQQRPAYVTGRLYLKLHNALNMELPQFASAGGMVELKNHPDAHIQAMATLLEQHGATYLKKPFRTRSMELDRTYEVRFTDGANTVALMNALSRNPLLEYAEQVPANYLDETLFTPNDYNAAQQWFLGAINAPAAWDISLGDPNVVIAITDDGVDIAHLDLVANVWVNPNEIPGNGIDDDNNGRIDDINGWDSADNDANVINTNPLASHGTHVAGCASGVSGNGIGIASIGYSCSLMACKSTKDSNPSNPPTIDAGYESIDYAIDNGADVINMSWGGTSSSATNQNLINAGWAKGCMFVASAGNGGTDGVGDDHATIPKYPSGYNRVLSVASSGQNGQKTAFSDFGIAIDVVAPGSNIKSTYPNGIYAVQDGTSMSAPIVAGLCALMKSVNPCLKNDSIEKYLKQTCTPITGSSATLFNQGKLGAGVIDASAALQAVLITAAPDPTFTFTVAGPCSDKVSFKYIDANGLFACPATIVQWDIADAGGNLVASSNDINPTVSIPTGPGTYTVSILAVNSVGDKTNTQTVTINVGESLYVNAGPNLTPCVGSPVQLAVTSTITPASVSWSPTTGLNAPTTLAPILTPSLSANYIVTITSPTGCTAKDTVFVQPKTSPATNISLPTTAASYTINAGQSVTLKAGGANTYTWSPNIGLSGTTGAQITAQPWSNVTYKVVGAFTSGCTKTDSIQIVVNNPTAIDNAFAQMGVVSAVSPNPTQGEIALNATFARTGDLRIALYDLSGRGLSTLYAGKVNEGTFTHQANMGRYAAGVYLIVWEMNGATYRQKLEIQ